MTIIVTEGPASQAVLEAICTRAGVKAKVRSVQGKPKLFSDFDKLFALAAPGARRIVAPDLHPEADCVAEAERWRAAIKARAPGARLSLVIWETESWLLADPGALQRAFGISLKHGSPEATTGEKPSRLLESAFKKKGGYTKGAAFDKKADGVRIVQEMDLETARARAPSLDRFLRLVGA